MMEKTNAVSEYRFEDEFCFITEEGSIFRKGNDYQSSIKLGEASPDNWEEKMRDYRHNFAAIEEEIAKLDDEISGGQLQQWNTKLQQAKAIGDFDRLFKQLEERGAANGQDEDKQKPDAEAESGIEEKTKKDPLDYYKSLRKKAQEVAQSEDWSRGSKKLNELSHKWSDGPEVEGEEAGEEVKDLYYKFTKAEEHFKNHKAEHQKKAAEKRSENLAQKKKVIDKIQQVVKDENWNATGQIKNLQRTWQHTGPVPKEQAAELKSQYRALIKEFKSHKVDRLVAKRQQAEDNLMMKMAVLDKLEKVANGIDKSTSNWKKVDEQFDKLTRQWKKIGRAPREKSRRVWSRFKSAQDVFYNNKYKYNKNHRSNVDSFTAKKENIIADAEGLVEQDDIAKAARQVNKLHRRWKKIGNLPQSKEDKLWDRFKAATDAFNQKKAENVDKIAQQENEHYRQKLTLIEQAEETKATDDWKKGHRKMQSFMKKWKKIGPVPRRQSRKIWKQFKGAMDVFYDRRREHFKEAKEEQKENLKKKKDILEKLRDLGRADDPVEAVDEAKKLQEQFKDIGYVPIKKKNEMWGKYREVCDVIYDRMRAAKSGSTFDKELAKADLSAGQRSQIQKLRKQYKKLKKEVRGLKQEVIQQQESKANFNFSDDDNPILTEINDKISKKKAKLESKQHKMDALQMEMEDIREEA